MFAPPRPRASVRTIAVPTLGLLALLLAGCGADHHDPMSPMMTRGGTAVAPPRVSEDGALLPGFPNEARVAQRRGFYPLAIGNQWSYAARFTVTLFDSAGNGALDFDEATRIDRTLTRVVTLYGHDYTEEVSARRGVDWADPLLSTVYYRQDFSGLYEADLLIRLDGSAPAAAAARADRAWDGTLSPAAARRVEAVLRAIGPKLSHRAALELLARLDRATGAASALATGFGGPLDHEITRLAYPLYMGARWVIRADPRFESTVERIAPIDEPAGRFVAARIRIDSEFFGPNDRVHLWYGRDGFLKLAARIEIPVTDSSGKITGIAVAEQTEDLVSLRLFDPRGQNGVEIATNSGNP
ncbi:MAG: hypothetical protein HYR73_06190 [Candidatus Eisenbacteria bacterium]|nr:hypothetical protein [Candidatus Eisenbacteria bacterium]